MANRGKILERLTSRYKTPRGRDELVVNGQKKRRPNWDGLRRAKQAQYEQEDEK